MDHAVRQRTHATPEHLGHMPHNLEMVTIGTVTDPAEEQVLFVGQ